jgi:hydroxymethylglutaryl-CoA lyase
MQGWPAFIPTEIKIQYLNQLLQVGFHTLDFGSFVSAKAIPQMQDTAEVLANLNLAGTNTKLLAIIANLRGAEKAAGFPEVTYLGFPLSLSETFQQRNTNKSIAEAFTEVGRIQELCARQSKILVVYLSMGFGNPYQDPWNAEVVLDFVRQLLPLQVQIISLADTIGLAKPGDIIYLFTNLVPEFPAVEFGAHFHGRPDNWLLKIEAAAQSGCERFDGALKGFGGCPMAIDELTGNMPTEKLVAYFENNGINLNLNKPALQEALSKTEAVFLS